MGHHLENNWVRIIQLIAYEHLFIVIEVDMKYFDVNQFIERFICFFFTKGSMVKTFLLILINSIGVDIIHNDSYWVVPVSFKALNSDVYVIDIKNGIIYNPNKIFLSKCLIFVVIPPLFFHF
jgi:hypothetical protein